MKVSAQTLVPAMRVVSPAVKKDVKKMPKRTVREHKNITTFLFFFVTLDDCCHFF